MRRRTAAALGAPSIIFSLSWLLAGHAGLAEACSSSHHMQTRTEMNSVDYDARHPRPHGIEKPISLFSFVSNEMCPESETLGSTSICRQVSVDFQVLHHLKLTFPLNESNSESSIVFKKVAEQGLDLVLDSPNGPKPGTASIEYRSVDGSTAVNFLLKPGRLFGRFSEPGSKRQVYLKPCKANTSSHSCHLLIVRDSSTNTKKAGDT